MIKHLKSEEFKDFISQEGMTIIDFWATWCGPCRMLSPVLEELDKTITINIGKVDVDSEDDIATAFGVSSIPTLLLFRNGKLVSKSVGYRALKDLTSWVKENE